nr:hypothetical protein HK105_004884 [Polyrhizophydium stewartii]
MEIELKLRLASKAAHTAVIELFRALPGSRFLGTDRQENFFLDGPARDFVRLDALTGAYSPKSVVTLKGKGGVRNGVSVNEELEEPIDDKLLDLIVHNPSVLPSVAGTHPLLAKVMEEHPQASQLEVTGSFKNERNIFEWSGLKLEIDETQYSFGSAYEIEVEHDDPQRAKDLLLPLLRSNGIDFTNSQRTKFANMKFGSVL